METPHRWQAYFLWLTAAVFRSLYKKPYPPFLTPCIIPLRIIPEKRKKNKPFFVFVNLGSLNSSNIVEPGKRAERAPTRKSLNQRFPFKVVRRVFKGLVCPFRFVVEGSLYKVCFTFCLGLKGLPVSPYIKAVIGSATKTHPANSKWFWRRRTIEGIHWKTSISWFLRY